MASLEEASRCPRCNMPGEQTSSTPAFRWVGSRKQRAGKALNFVCRNEQCRWFENGGWIVQVREDGTIPDPSKQDKKFVPLSGDQEAAARRVIEDLQHADPGLQERMEQAYTHSQDVE